MFRVVGFSEWLTLEEAQAEAKLKAAHYQVPVWVVETDSGEWCWHAIPPDGCCE